MACRKYLILLTLLISCLILKAQDINIATADSISKNLYNAGEWRQLIDFGKETLAKNVDFQLLRERMGYACFVTGDYRGALQQYDHLLARNSYDPTARYYAYYCNLYLNNNQGAAVNAAYLDSATLKKENINKYTLTDAVLETGLKFSQNTNRGNGFYTRVGLGNRIGWRLQLQQSLIYFNQNIANNTATAPFGGNSANNTDSQFEYYFKAGYAINADLILIGAYHYLNTRYLNSSYNNNIGLLGIKFMGGRYVDLQADINLGNIIGAHVNQYNAQLTYYPNGNLNLYTISRASLKSLNNRNQFIFSQSAGFKVADKTWLEANVTAGDMENYIDADGLYVYNAIDNTKFKSGATAFYQVNFHTMLQLNYTYETKYDIYRAVNYGQHSITAGLVWKF